MRLVDVVNEWRVYSLDFSEAHKMGRCYPCFVCWHEDDPELVGIMKYAENETGNIADMVHWCEEN